MAAGASAGCILRLRGGNWEYGVERKFVRGHYDPHGSEFQVDLVARANAGSRRRIVVVADGEIIQPKSSSSLRAALRSKSRRTTFVRPEMPKQSSGELWGSHGVKEGGVGLSLIPPMHPEAPLGLLQVAFPAAGMLFCPGMTGSSELHALRAALCATRVCLDATGGSGYGLDGPRAYWTPHSTFRGSNGASRLTSKQLQDWWMGAQNGHRRGGRPSTVDLA